MKVRDYRTGGGFIRGIDVSSYQGNINFSKVKANNIRFAILRAYGSNHSAGGDTRIKEYASGFSKVGIPCGSYFFAMIPSNGALYTAREQANMYADKLEGVFGKKKWGQLLPFIDVENNGNVGGTHESMSNSLMVAWIKEFRNTFEARFDNKVKLGIYTSWSFIKDHFPNGELKDMPLWVAKWRTTSIPDVGGFTNWVAWQYTDNAYPFSSGQSVGVSSSGLDMNYTESLEDLMMIEQQVEVRQIKIPTPQIWNSFRGSILLHWGEIAVKNITAIDLYRNGVLIKSLSDWVGYRDWNVKPNTDYSYHIVVHDEKGSYKSAVSNKIKTPVASPSAPTGLITETFDRGVKLTWNYNPEAELVESYAVYLDNERIDVTVTNNYIFQGLEPNRSYTFNVQAINNNPIHSDLSASVIATPIIEYPNKPFNLRSAVDKNKKVLLEWDYDEKENFSHFDILLNDNIRINDVKTKNHTLSGLISNQNYSIKVIAYDSDNDFMESDIINVEIYEPLKITDFNVTPRDRKVILNWNQGIVNDKIKNYLIWQNDSLITVVANTVTSLTIPNLENNKLYTYSIQGVSIQDIVGVLSDPITVSPIQDFPNKATNLEAIVENENTILFKWDYIPSENFSHLDVKINDNIVLPKTIAKEYRYTGAFANKKYKLEIISYDVDGDATTSGVIETIIDIPSVPKNVKISPKDREAILTWDFNPEPFIKGYNIFVNEQLHSFVSSTNYLTITGLLNEVVYTFQVQAVGVNNFTSDKSFPINGKTKLVVPQKPVIIMHRELGNNGVELIWEHEEKEYHSHYNVYKNGFLIARNIKEKFFQTNYLESNKTHSFQIEAFDTQGDRSGFSNSYFVTLYAKILEPLSVFVGRIDEQVEVIKPNIYLCKPNKQTIAKLNDAKNINFISRYADLNELSFSISANAENNFEMEKNSNLDNLRERYLIRLEYGKHVEYFIINEINQSSEFDNKTVHCWSLGYELKDKLINNYTEEIYTALSAMQIAIENVLNWSLGANIKNEDFYWNQETRSFDVTNMTVLDFIISIATSFNAILVWDTINRVIDFRNPTLIEENRGLKIKYGKYLKSLSKTSTTEQMVTHLRPIGENNLSIRDVTVNGSDVLEDFSYFLNGFELESDEYANFYLDSKAIVVNPLDEYYTNLGFQTVPKGAIFSSVDNNGNVSHTIKSEDVSLALINMIRLFETTKSPIYLLNAKMFGDFLMENKRNGLIVEKSFNFIPNEFTYNTLTAMWETTSSNIEVKNLYLSFLAMLKLYKHNSKTEYLEYIENLIPLLAHLFNDVQQRISLKNLPLGYEGLIYSTLIYNTINENGDFTFELNLTDFSNSILNVFSQAWLEYIYQFGNPNINDILGNIITPQQIFDTTKTFFDKEYHNFNLLMPNINLPYTFYQYDPTVDFETNAESVDGKTYIPKAKNYDYNNKLFSKETWFKMEDVLNIAIGYKFLDLYEISQDFRNKIFDLKSASHFTENQIVFFERYNIDGTAGIDFDITKLLLTTGMYMELEILNDNTEFFNDLKNTILHYQIVNENKNLNHSFISNVEDTNSILDIKTINQVIFPLAHESQIKILNHSPYMSDDLAKAIIGYQKLLERKDGIFQNFIQEKKARNEELVELKYEQIIKETDLFIVQDLLDSLKANQELWFDYETYAGLPRTLSWTLKKDYKYAIFAKTDNINDITISTPSGVKTFANNDEWILLQKINFDRTGETTAEKTINEYDFEVQILGSTNANLEFQVNRILNTEFDAIENESQLIETYIEEIKQKIYDEQTALVTSKETEIESINNEIETLQSELSVYNNFTSEQREERDLFVITKEFIDEKIANPEELKNIAIEKFDEIKNPIITIEINIVNLLEVLEEHYNWDKLEIGTILNIFYDKLNISLEAKIIEMSFDFTAKTINLIISNVKEIKTNQEKFINALYGAISASTTVSIEKHNWSKAIEVKEDFDSFVNKEFDATKQKIIAGTNESVEISRRGLLIKNDIDPFSFLVANASVLAITNDGGRSYKNAITTDGIIGERIVGKILAGENLIIENANGTFKVDGNGVTISNQALNIIGGITQEQISNDVTFKTDLSGITGSYVDVLEENKENSTIPHSPTFTTNVGAVTQYTNVTNDLVNLSYDWDFLEDNSLASDIDGFMVYVYTSSSSAPYVFGNNPQNEISFHVKYDKRSIIFYNVPKNLYYQIGIEAYRVVDTTIDPTGIIKSPIVQTSPYKPALYEAYTGNIIGTINYGKEVKVKPEILSAIRLGMSYDNVTIDTANGLQATSSDNTQKTIINSNGFRIQTNDGTGFLDKLYANASGIVAEDLTANRLIVNDGTGRELINAKTKQINFDNFEVVTGKISANGNVDMRSLTVVNDLGVSTFKIDNTGNVSLEGNIKMTSGSISWTTLDTPNGFYVQDNNLYFNADFIKSGNIDGNLITGQFVEAGHIKSLNGLNIGNGQFVVDSIGNVTIGGTLNGASGTFSGDLIGGSVTSNTSINVITDLQVGKNIYLARPYENRFDEKTIFFNDESSYVSKIAGTYLKLEIICDNTIRLISNVLEINSTSVRFNNNNAITFNGVQPQTSTTEKGWCGTGANSTLTTSGDTVSGVGVNFRLKKSYVPSSISLTRVSGNSLTVEAIAISEDGFWLYVTKSSGAGFYFWRGYYLA